MQAKAEAVSLCFTLKINILVCCFSLQTTGQNAEKNMKKKKYNMLFNQKHMKQKKNLGTHLAV